MQKRISELKSISSLHSLPGYSILDYVHAYQYLVDNGTDRSHNILGPSNFQFDSTWTCSMVL